MLFMGIWYFEIGSALILTVKIRTGAVAIEEGFHRSQNARFEVGKY